MSLKTKYDATQLYRKCTSVEGHSLKSFNYVSYKTVKNKG